jgi:uncharacterized protein
MKLLLILLIAVVGCTASNMDYGSAEVVLPGTDGDVRIHAEVPQTLELFMQGLMHRTVLSRDRGMLFVYEDEQVRTFWMKNTLIPLDMIFITQNGTIAKIHYAVPCIDEPCAIYSSEVPVQYVLEVVGNLTAEKGIEEQGLVLFS